MGATQGGSPRGGVGRCGNEACGALLSSCPVTKGADEGRRGEAVLMPSCTLSGARHGNTRPRRLVGRLCLIALSRSSIAIGGLGPACSSTPTLASVPFPLHGGANGALLVGVFRGFVIRRMLIYGLRPPTRIVESRKGNMGAICISLAAAGGRQMPCNVLGSPGGRR